MSPSLQKAFFLESFGGEYALRTKEIQKPGAGEILVKSRAVGLNPIDWGVRVRKLPFYKNYPVILGFDNAGTVEEVGDGVTSFKKGDRVVLPGGMTNDYAAFQQYSLASAELAAKIPDNISFDQAATVPLCLATAAEGLYGNADRAETGAPRLPYPWEANGQGVSKGKAIVVFGGASSVGQYAIQLLKLSGFSTIITTASPHNADLLKSIGATHVLDRKSDVVAEVKKIVGDEPIELVYDAIGMKETQTQALEIVPEGGQVVSVRQPIPDKSEYPNKYMTRIFAAVHNENVRALGVSMYSKLTGLLESGAIKPNRVEVVPGGLAGLTGALERMEKTGVSGVKLVIRPDETP